MNNRNINNMSPFITFCQKVIPLAYDESMSYYESICALRDYIGQMIDAVNNNADAVTELQNAFNTLQNYVDNYFKNLDVQTEINNKLDEMAESGELTNLIAQYLQIQSLLTFDTVDEMKESENLINGSYALTYGYYNINDGGSAKYKIREIKNTDTINNKTIIALKNPQLIAELITDKSINIKQLGAYGDNIHDDSETIKIGINYALNNKIPLIIPKGDYKCDNTLNLEVNDLSIIGENGTIIHNETCDSSFLYFLNSYNINIKH